MVSMDENLESSLKQIVKPYLDRGRPGDYEHTLRTICYARKLLQHEKGEEIIVIPTLYLHDIGWSQVNFKDFIKAPSLSQRMNAASVDLHMKHGAVLAKIILKKLGFSTEMVQIIASIIAVHDKPEDIFAMDNPSATIVLEADHLDKYGPKTRIRFENMFGILLMDQTYKNEIIERLRNGLKSFFRTRTAKSMALKLAKESGLFTQG